ncbi:MAG: phytanoyl-CoA dioxygenase family protein [Bryobacteraceae bacterium]|nr:phytanoyl-CoA dioxygenase family protein [Bryobacteraceae bacterium]
MLSSAQKNQISELGYVVLENYLNASQVRELNERIDELFAQEGTRAGSEFKQEPGAKRLANLVDKGEVFERAVAMPEILEGTGTVICERFKLSSLNVRETEPHSEDAQPLHADMGAIPDELGYWVSNTVWMLDDFTRDNGAIRAVPGTHKLGKLPQDVLTDLRAPHPDEALITGPAGTVVIMNAHCWHGGTANRTAKPRRAMHSFYCRWDKPQQQWQKQLLRPETLSRLSPELRQLLALDDPENDRITSTNTVRSGFLK